MPAFRTFVQKSEQLFFTQFNVCDQIFPILEGHMDKFIRCLLFGPAGSGKSTIRGLMVKRFPMKYVYSGDLIRKEIYENTEFGQKAKEYVERGQVVPDDLVNELMVKTLKDSTLQNTNLLLDGYPRTLNQCKVLHDVAPPNLVIEIDVPRDVIIDRMSKRYIHPASGRTYNLDFNPPKVPGKDDVTGEPLIRRIDDTPEAIARRLEHYYSTESWAVEWYMKQRIVHRVSGNTTKEIWPKVSEIVEKYLKPQAEVTVG